MKTYPSIGSRAVDQPIHAFDKLDGSNIRAEWSKKTGFHKFGSRKRLVDPDDTLLGQSTALIWTGYADDLARVFRAQRWDRAVCFFEFHGPNSFAGRHDGVDMKVTLFDVAPHPKGILEPQTFLELFGHLDHAPSLYQGIADEAFIASVRDRTLAGMTYEGVVCKGKHVSPGSPLMFKIKSDAWVEQVKERFGNDEQALRDLL